MNWKEDIKWFIASMAILFPIIFFPISSDLSSFMHGGLILANGGELYKDFIDIKPPLIYYIFAGLDYLFGKGVFVYRIFDFIYQMCFLLTAVAVFRKLGVKNSVIKSFLILFPLSYTILNYRDVLQTESLAFIPMLVYFYFLVKKDYKPKTVILIGLMLGLSLSLKYTLGIIFIASIPAFFSVIDKKSKAILLLFTQLFVALIVLSLTILPIIVQGNLEWFLAVNSFIAEYSKYPPISSNFVKESLTKLLFNFGNLISITYLFFFLLGSLFYIKNDKNRILKNSLIMCLLLFISILIERKMSMYHITRIFPFFILIVSFGAAYFFKRFKFRKNLVSVVFVLIFIFLSPFLRFVNTYKIVYDRVFNYEAFVNYYTKDGTFNLMRYHIELAKYINQLKDDKFLFINTGGNQAIFHLDFKYKYKFSHSSFHLSPKAPKLLKKAFDEDLQDANIVAIDSCDDIFTMFLAEGSSYDLFMKEPEYRNYINKNFTLDTLLSNRYFIYKRNSR